MDYILIFILALLFGSFFNVCIYRVPRGESIAFPPSHCTNCNHKLNFLDLFPIFSYIFLKGQCRYCKEKISLRYPLVEGFNAIIWVLIYKTYGYSIFTVKYIFLFSIMLIMSLIDYDTQNVYFSNTLIGIIGAVIFIFLELHLNLNESYIFLLKNYILGGLIPALVIVLIAITTKGMGLGDAEAIFICGLILGIKKSLFLMMLSFIIGGIVGTILILCKKKDKKDPVAFVPYIAAASLIMILYGDAFINWYFTHFLGI